MLWKQEYNYGRPPGGRYRKNSFASETPVTDGKRVYVYALTETGILSRYEAQTGKLSYRSLIEGGMAFTSSPWAYSGKIFCLNEEGKTFVIAAGENSVCCANIIQHAKYLRSTGTQRHLWELLLLRHLQAGCFISLRERYYDRADAGDHDCPSSCGRPGIGIGHIPHILYPAAVNEPLTLEYSI